MFIRCSFLTNYIWPEIMNVVSDILGGHMKLVGGVRKILHVKIQDPGPGGHCAAADNHHQDQEVRAEAKCQLRIFNRV